MKTRTLKFVRRHARFIRVGEKELAILKHTCGAITLIIGIIIITALNNRIQGN